MRTGYKKLTFVYAAQVEGGGFVKFGASSSPLLRVGKLQAWSPWKLSFVAAVRAPQLAEHWLHDIMTPYRERNEWYWPTEQVISAANYMLTHGKLPMDICRRAFDFLGMKDDGARQSDGSEKTARSEIARLTWARRKCLIWPHAQEDAPAPRTAAE